MGLKEYKAKRRFDETPEPSGGRPAKGKLRFVIQKHDATRLHYDFRLEMEGVMKSWAVPKGPSLNTKDKRLAMMTEDHPMDYRTFEGVIPAGNYGAGEVIVWDEGTYRPLESANSKDHEKILLKGLEDGNLKIFVEGKKIQGGFAFIKIKSRDGEKDNAWLLIKERDEFVSERDVTSDTRSVRSNKILSRDGGDSFRGSSKAKNIKPKARGKDKMPRDVRPMLATLVDEPFDRKGWLFELKYDGYRAIAEVEHKKVSLYSRKGISFAEIYPEVVRALENLGHEAVLDGEVVAVDKNGKPRFQYLQNWGDRREGTMLYYIFDILYLDGESLINRPLKERKEILKTILPANSIIKYSDHVEEKGESFFKSAEKHGLEGIMAKDGESVYKPGVRGSAWLKIKTSMRQEAVIAGFTEPRGSREKFGALVLGVYEKGELIYAGHTGTGFDQKTIARVYGLLEPLITKTSPFKKIPKTNMPVTWVRPDLVCEIKYTEWTDDGSMRHPVFIGMRTDKPPREVKREKAEEVEEVVREEEVQTGKPEVISGVRLTHPEKVYWPKEGYTKRDLFEYYRAVAETMLPHLVDRPESLNRHPHGIEGESFFQKNMDMDLPPFTKTVKIRSDSEDKMINWLICQNKETLLYMANLGCIEINPWNSRYMTPDRPDYMVIDLDPDGNPYDEVVQVALVTKKILEKAGVRGYPKTSGKSGMHISIPLKAKYSQDEARQFGEIIANLVHAKIPEITSVTRDPKKRKGKIYVDFLQNRIGQTIAAPYSVRPYPGATVSAPLKWTEVKKGLLPSKFTIKTMPARIKKVGDLWCPVQEKGVDLEKALASLLEK